VVSNRLLAFVVPVVCLAGAFAVGTIVSPLAKEGAGDSPDSSRWIFTAIAFVVGTLIAAMGTREWVTARTAGTPDT
jgi:hypothetical protein